jgi:hypothetical protein
MTRNRMFALLLAVILGIVLVPLVVDSSNAAAQNAAAQNGKCSLRTIKGTYGAEVSGWAGSGAARLPVTEVGYIALDGRGNIAGAAQTSIDGVQGQVTIAGSYTVAADTCTGTATTTIGSFFFVIVDNGQETRIIATDPGVTIHGEAIRQ